MLELILLIVVAGVVTFAINKWIPMPAWAKKLLNIVVCVILVLFVMQAFGACEYLEKKLDRPVPKIGK